MKERLKYIEKILWQFIKFSLIFMIIIVGLTFLIGDTFKYTQFTINSENRSSIIDYMITNDCENLNYYKESDTLYCSGYEYKGEYKKFKSEVVKRE